MNLRVQPQMTSNISPALHALQKLETEIKKRSGKEGGTLNEKNLQYLQTIKATLLQIEPLGNMLKAVNQQTEVAVHVIRNLQTPALHQGNDDDNGDDGSSETKGN